MKKPLAVVASLGILVGGFSFVSSESVEAATTIVKEQKKNTPPRKEEVLVLTLDEVIEKALANDKTILAFGYQYEILKAQREMTHDNIDELEEKKDDAESAKEYIPVDNEIIRNEVLPQFKDILGDRTYEELSDEEKLPIDAATHRIRMENINKRDVQDEEITKITDKIQESIDDLDAGLKQNNRDNKKIQLQVDESKEGIRYMMKGRYMSLLSKKEGLALQTRYISALKTDIFKAEQESDFGIASLQGVKLLKRELKNQENELAKNQKSYEKDLMKLLTDLGYRLTLNVEFTPPLLEELEKVDPNTSKNVKESFLANSYELKKIELEIDKLEYDAKKLAEKDKDKDENANVKYQERINKQQLNLQTEEKQRIEEDITKNITTLFTEAEEAYDLIEEKAWKRENEKEDERKLEIQYELGVISKHEFEKKKIAFEQADFDEHMARVAFYLKLEEISMLEKGMLLSQR